MAILITRKNCTGAPGVLPAFRGQVDGYSVPQSTDFKSGLKVRQRQVSGSKMTARPEETDRQPHVLPAGQAEETEQQQLLKERP